MKPALPLLVGLVAALLTTSARGADPLHYSFNPGDHFIYDHQSVIQRKADAERLSEQRRIAQVWCLARDSDFATLLIESADPAAPLSSIADVVQIDPFGRIHAEEPAEARLSALYDLFGVLPTGGGPLVTTDPWLGPTDCFGRAIQIVTAGPDPRVADTTRYDFKWFRSIAALQDQAECGRGAFWFDARGFVRRAESHESAPESSTETSQLLDLRTGRNEGATWAVRAADDGRKFLRALANEDRLLDELVRNPENAGRALDLMDRVWSACAAEVTREGEAPFYRVATARRAQIRAEVDALRARAAFAARWLNKPTPDWSLQNAGGQTVTSEQTRAPLTVEVFWKSDPDSARLFNSLRGLRGELEKRGGKLICMNIDDDPMAAARGIAAYGGGFTHVLAGPMKLLMNFPATPVLRVIDERLVTRRICIGWRASYLDLLP